MAAFLKNTNSMRRFRKTRRGAGFLDSVTQGLTGLTEGVSGMFRNTKAAVSNAANSGVDAARGAFNPVAEYASQQGEAVPNQPIGGRRRSRKSRKSRRR